MAKLTPGDMIGPALEKELNKYHKQVTDGVNAASLGAAKKLSKKLRATAPKNSGKFARSIGYTSQTSPVTGSTTYTVGAKGKEGRKTHLIVHGHATRDGGRTKGNPFFANAVNEVLPEYEKDIKQVIERGLIE